jgi:hypothetical protein
MDAATAEELLLQELAAAVGRGDREEVFVLAAKITGQSLNAPASVGDTQSLATE